MNALALRAPHILALGAGGCGIELGLKLVMPSARIVGYVEREIFAAANLAAKIEEGVLDEAPIWSDVATFDGSRYRGYVDIVSIGLPCQPFSTAGKRKGIKDERWLWPEVWRIICQVEPQYFFMEEVRGFVQSGFSYTLRDLASSGWSAEWDLFSAAAVGAPHKRERFFLLADSNRKGFNRKRLHVSKRGSREAISDACGSGKSLGYANSAVSGDRQGGSSKGQVAVEGCDELADTPIKPKRKPNNEACAESRKDSRAGIGRGNSVFPPGPADTEAWQRILAIDPSLEPAICRNANGMATRLERLRLCGNGVVPLVAAVAWSVLGEHLGEV